MCQTITKVVATEVLATKDALSWSAKATGASVSETGASMDAMSAPGTGTGPGSAT